MALFGKRKDGQAYPKNKKKGTKRKGAILATGKLIKRKKNDNWTYVRTRMVGSQIITTEDAPTTNEGARKGVVGLKEMGLTLKDVKGKTPVFVPLNNPSSFELIGWSTSPANSDKIFARFTKIMNKNPNMTFKQYRKKYGKKNK